MYICGLNSDLKCIFNSTFEKKHQNCMSYMKRLSKCPYLKKPHLPRKIPGCATDLLSFRFFIEFFSSTFFKRISLILPRAKAQVLKDLIHYTCTTQKMKFSIKDFFSKCDKIPSFLRIWSHLLKKP